MGSQLFTHFTQSRIRDVPHHHRVSSIAQLMVTNHDPKPFDNAALHHGLDAVNHRLFIEPDTLANLRIGVGAQRQSPLNLRNQPVVLLIQHHSGNPRSM